MTHLSATPPRVLIVDDVPADRIIFRRCLTDGEGIPCAIAEVASGAAAREYLRRHQPDCVLLDFDLPDGDSLSLVRDLVNLCGPHAFGIVMLTSATNFELALEALKSGAHDFLPKGAATAISLRRAVDNAIEKAAIQRELESQRCVLAEKNQELEIHVARLEQEVAERKKTERELEIARDRAVAASRAKDDFLAALSHELRTPLSPVLLLASEAAENSEIPEEVRRIFETIRKNVDLEARLIDDLLNITRISRGKLALDRHTVNVHAVLTDALANVNADLEQKYLSLRLHLDAPWHTVMGDAVRLQQVFWNVLKNAVKFTPEGGSVSVTTHSLPEPDQLEIIIEDSGIGMNGEEVDRIFDAFAQGEHAGEDGSHRFGGLGLGLAIARMLVESHAGVISAASAGPGQGSVFTIRLPLAPQVGETLPIRPHIADAGGAAANVEPSLTRILLVEDHEPTRSALAQLLTRRKYQVVTADTAAAALAAAAQHSFDLLISDIGLPDGNGNDLMTALAKDSGLRGIALTGYGMEHDVSRSTQAGFHTHLIKPIRVEQLTRAIQDTLAAPSSASAR